MAAEFVKLVGVGYLALSLCATSVMSGQAVAVGARTDKTVEVSPVSVDVENVALEVALESIARQAKLIPYYSAAVSKHPARVTLHLKRVPASEAFEKALAGTELRAAIIGGNVLFEKAVSTDRPINIGSIVGHVLDARTRRALRGAAVTVDGNTKGVSTAEDGAFQLANLSVGEHTLRVRLLGYARVAKKVAVVDGQATSIELALEPSVSTLDQVVVTGTVAATERKAIPNAITVITAKDIEQRGITRIDQLFRGDVPGLFSMNRGAANGLDQVTMFSRGATALNNVSVGTENGTNPIKTYIDGVEMADSRYLSQIDPRNVERIEILTGPQASTVYGSNALNGVMQIFTKRGSSSQPQLTLNLLSGLIQNNFSSALTPQHDYNAQLNGVEGRLSYNAGGSWVMMGAWSPGKQVATTNAFGGTRLALPTAIGPVTTDVSLRRTMTLNKQRGDGWQGYTHAGLYAPASVTSRAWARPAENQLWAQTLGVTAGYAPLEWWSHELVLGQDVSQVAERLTARGYSSPSDTVLFLSQSNTDRRSLRYSTTARVPVTDFAQATVTLGADGWQSLNTFMSARPTTLAGTLRGSESISRTPDHNTGAFLQAQFGIVDKLYLTYGLRAEWNPGFGADVTPSYAPRYGAAYTQDIGALTAKVRASYGRSTRPPRAGLKAASPVQPSSLTLIRDYGIFDLRLANPDLRPEVQQGGEGGLELYLGTRGSLVITRYNQTVEGLISSVTTDSVQRLDKNPDPWGYCVSDPQWCGTDAYFYQKQALNVGDIRNQGWELQGSVNTGPLTTRGTYSWTKSRTIGVNPLYRRWLTDPQYQPGATFKYLPEHTWAVGVTYAHAASTVTLNVSGVGQLVSSADAFSDAYLTSVLRLTNDRLRVINSSRYVNMNSGYALADLTASHRFSSRVEGMVQVQNLTDKYTNDYFAAIAAIGRQAKGGFRIRW